MDTISRVQTDGYTIFLKVINFIFKYKVWYKNYFASKINIGYNYSLRRVTSRGRELPKNTKEIQANLALLLTTREFMNRKLLLSYHSLLWFSN